MRTLFVGLALVAAASLVAVPALPAGAGARSSSPLDQRVLERTALVPAAATITAYAAPTSGRVVLTRFCGSTCVRCEGKTLGGTAFRPGGRGCVDHQPGIVLPPGETVQCTNHCGRMDAALFSGVLGP